MQGPNHPRARICFGAYEVDWETGELRKHGVRIKLQAQPFQVLEMLLEHPGALVTREELKRKLWPIDTFGDFDHGLNKAINKIREALADSALNPRYIETVARRGYRFIAPVTTVDEPRIQVQAVAGHVPDTKQENHERIGKPETRPAIAKSLVWKIAGAALFLFFASLFIWKVQLAANHSDIQSLAVLPLENLSTDVSQEYFADGMTDELITALGTIHGLRVISRTSVMLYKHAAKPLSAIGRELSVDAVVEGTVLVSGQQVRITAQLIRVATDDHLWSQSYEGDLRDTLQLQDRVARAIAGYIRLKVSSRGEASLSHTNVVNPDAQDAYLRGRYFWNKRTEQGLKKAIGYFHQAISIDPNYAQAYSGLADSYALLGDWEYGALAPKEAFPKAKAAATAALRLNDTLSEAHASLAFCLDLFDWDWKLAEIEFKRAIALNQNYATAHQWYAWHLLLTGRKEQAISELKKAEVLDPLSLIISADIADALLIARRYSESIRQSEQTIEMDPSFAMGHYQLGQSLAQIHNNNVAILELRQAIELSGGNRLCTSQLAYVYAVSGRPNEAKRILEQLKGGSNQSYSNAADIALIYAGLNDKDQAFAWLEKAYEPRFNPSVLLRPAFDILRSDPRFENLMHRLDLS